MILYIYFKDDKNNLNASNNNSFLIFRIISKFLFL